MTSTNTLTPRYSSGADYSLSSDKNPVVLELGRAYTKCGFAREPSPRAVIPSQVAGHDLYSYSHASELPHLLQDFLYTVYYKHLCTSPKDRRLVVVESLMVPTEFKDTLASVLYEHFEVPAIVFVPSHLCALYTLRLNTALVVNVGFRETTVLPVFEGVCVLQALGDAPLGSYEIHRRLESFLLKFGRVLCSDGQTCFLGELNPDVLANGHIVEDIKVRTCFITPRERHMQAQTFQEAFCEGRQLELPAPSDVRYPLEGDKVLEIPGTLREFAPECLFELDNEMISVATLVLDVLLQCNRDSRRVLAENIVLIGGTVMLPGFKRRLKEELLALLQEPRYKGKLFLDKFKFHTTPCCANVTAWLGGSVYGATDYVSSQAMTKDQFIENRKHIPDWADQKWKTDVIPGL
ncbi:actin-related protein 10-like [Varroa jacobsoni]|uniref:Actin-related protein 10 n=1 Tax=Varroa destructor TaxID=109461 RepID=A0A7M7KP58_VARDE|nr:actin-related protein 10-like [Varroa destructor]XP_022702007.1 actin-related protein 10-like [Varroa jacobsoni]